MDMRLRLVKNGWTGGFSVPFQVIHWNVLHELITGKNILCHRRRLSANYLTFIAVLRHGRHHVSFFLSKVLALPHYLSTHSNCDEKINEMKILKTQKFCLVQFPFNVFLFILPNIKIPFTLNFTRYISKKVLSFTRTHWKCTQTSEFWF